ncbi:hypothetical protein ASG76_05100 [Nocardioides sp. Soil774]|uniref:hypothetical protein n=1 Tax=Nocardioides sp. Soil774 TaxID=1736408 RepID=UPI0007002C18|nr:hypothetical protein [Nocardioides sp. Soil774]KRE95068.1 hypothetical protein ASG76_05100 [Nocardioides sp. Soil774]
MLRTAVLTSALALVLTACSGADDDTGPTPEPSPATPVVEASTPPGTELSFGDPATLVWQPTADLAGQLELSVDAVAEQRQSVFDGWLRDDAMAASRPYFVTVTLTNTGEGDLAGQPVPLYLRDETGRLGAPWTLGGDFTACQSGPLPTPFAAGATDEMCLVYLVPDRGRIRDLVFEPTEGYDPISWTGEVAAPEKRPARDEAGKKGRRG